MDQISEEGIFVDIDANREYKAGMFASIFNHEKSALSAYNAISGSNYPPDTPIKIVTLKNVLTKGRVNDLAFILGDRLIILIEHQSTINANMALRLLIYIALVYNAIYKGEHAVYGTRMINLREPEFYVLYNGTEEVSPVGVQRLSDLYSKEGLEPGHEFNLDLKVTTYNVNAPENAEMIKRSEELNGYVYCIKRINYYRSLKESDEDAIKHAIVDTKKKGFLVQFLEEHESEVINMLLQEFAIDEYGAAMKEQGLDEGRRVEKKAFALKLFSRNRPIEEIVEDTELPLTEVLNIKKELEDRK